MKVLNTISTTIIAAASGLLSPFIPDLTPTRLIAALEAYEPDSQAKSPSDQIRKPLSIKEVCKLLSISRPSVYRMKERGDLKFIKIGSLTRIPAEDVERLLSGDDAV
jgi:excisionase family DNA binding protein